VELAGPQPQGMRAKTEHDALLLETDPSLREGLAADFHRSSTDAHHLVTLLTLWVICRLETLAQAKEVADAWRSNVWVWRLAPLYWFCWFGVTTTKSLGRWCLRLVVCNCHALSEPVREEESAREFEIRAFWAIPLTGWFALVVIASLAQLCFIVPFEDYSQVGEHALIRSILGCVTRASIGCCFIGGTVALLLAMRRGDMVLLLACVVGFATFAVTMLALIILSVSVRSTRGWQWETEEILALIFSGTGFVAFGWYAMVCWLLWREYTGGAESAAKRASVEALAISEERGWAAVLTALCVGVLTVGLNLASELSDPDGYWNLIG